jgi:hypothetical protein
MIGLGNINNMGFGAPALSDMVFESLPGVDVSGSKMAAKYVEAAEKHGGSKNYICGQIASKSLNLLDKQIELTLSTPVDEDDGGVVGTRTTQAHISAESAAELVALYNTCYPNSGDNVIVEKRTGRVVRLLCQM